MWVASFTLDCMLLRNLAYTVISELFNYVYYVL